MKHILRYTAALFCVVLALTACLPEEPVHETINMGAGELTNLSSSAASLMCEIEDELPKYSKIEYGIVYSDNREKVENHKGVKKIEGQGLSENRFTVQLADLKAKQEYFYCSYLRIDEGRMIYGGISSFVTKASYKASFDANGGKGGMEPQHFEEDDNKALTDNAFTREHHEFAGWNTKADGSGNYYQPGSLYTLSEDVKLFAQWQAYSGMEEGYTYVDLGLSVEWATRNVGAERREAYGDYFAWGETQPKSNYAWETYQWGIASDLLTKYCIDAAHGKNGATDGKTVLELSDDAARVQWKGDWRMPTLAEQQELREKCSWKWKNLNGIAGYEVTGPSGKSIFLPAAGFKNNDAIYQQGSYGCYWSSSLYEIQSDYAYYLNIIPSTHEQAQYSRSYGYSLRPVYTTYYCLRFDANGGTGKMDSMMVKKTETATLSANTFTREGYIFTTWNTAADGSGTKVTDQTKFSPTSDTTFYAQWEIIKYKLSFNANGGTGTMSDQIFEYGAANTINANLFIREGFIFTGWNTQANASGTAYTDKQSITLTENTTLYAQWKRKTYTLTFDANGGEGTMSEQIYEFGVEQALRKNEFTRDGYIFIGWNTKSDGSGTSYSNQQIISIDFYVTLYAQWHKVWMLYFDANEGEGTMNPQIFEHGIEQQLIANTFTREGYVFTGWNTKADGSGISYSNKQAVTLTEAITLYAQWDDQPLYVSFEANGGAGEMELQVFAFGEMKALFECGFTPPSGKTFAGWNTKADGSGSSYSDKQIISVTQDLTLYAQWKIMHSVSFDANGGEGTMSEQIYEFGVEQALKKNVFTRLGYIFVSWNTKADGSGTSYRDNQKITIKGDLRLYAQWRELHSVSFDSNGGTGTMEPQIFEHGIMQELNTNTFRNQGYIFAYWNTKADGSGVSYFDNQVITVNESITLYAQWSLSILVSFDANGGVGTMPNQVFNNKPQKLNLNKFARSGYIFMGWNSKADGSGTSYSDGQYTTFTRSVRLYAQWKYDGFEWVDLGLPSGLKWATTNVGASSPTKPGWFVSWGEIEGKKTYNWATYKYGTGDNQLTKYCGDDDYSSGEYTDEYTILNLSDDAANVQRGGNWRIPTAPEFEELLQYCKWVKSVSGAVVGYEVIGPNGQSIFIPLPGYYDGNTKKNVDSYGYYWTSSLGSVPCNAYYVNIGPDYQKLVEYKRYRGYTIRPVCP